MKLFLKIIGYTFAGIVGLLVIAFIALQLISDEQYKKWLTGAAESVTGRTLAVDGELDVQIGPTLGLTARDVRFANAEWGSREDMVRADRLLAQLHVLSLFKGVLDVTLELDGPDILVETDGDGTGNWVFGTGAPQQELPEAEQEPKPPEEKSSLGLPLKPFIRNFQINDLVFVFADATTDTQVEATVEKLRLFVDGIDVPFDLVATYQGAPIELGGSLGDIEQWYANEPTQISLQGRLNEADLRLQGLAGPMLPEPNARIEVSLDAADVSTFEPFAGVELPSLQDLDISLTFLAADGQLSTANVTLNLQDPRLVVAVQGAVANLTEVSGIDVKAEITSEQATELFKGFNLPAQYSLPESIRLKAGVSGNLEQLAVSDLELLVQDAGLDISLTGGVENVLGKGSGSAELSVKLESSSLIGGYIGR
ncbi:MAG: AsmA family protein, partial [Desulfobulbaceae bacterium]